MNAVDVSLEPVAADSATHTHALKLSAPTWELNIWLTRSDLVALAKVRTARWADRSTVRIGESAGAAAHWSIDAGSLTILVGSDDETWDFSVSMPEGVLSRIISCVTV